MADEDGVRVSPVFRALADAVGLAQRGEFDQTLAADVALKAMAAQLRSMKTTINALYLITTVGAFLILAQPTSGDMSIEALGVKLPLSLLSKQALAIILSGAFAYYAAALISFMLLYGTMIAIVKRKADEGWEFILSPYFADILWMTLLIPKRLGYPSPRSERGIASLVYITNTAVVLGHACLVVGAVAIAGYAALQAGNIFGEILGALALISVIGALVGAISAAFLKLQYRPPKGT